MTSSQYQNNPYQRKQILLGNDQFWLILSGYHFRSIEDVVRPNPDDENAVKFAELMAPAIPKVKEYFAAPHLQTHLVFIKEVAAWIAGYMPTRFVKRNFFTDYTHRLTATEYVVNASQPALSEIRKELTKRCEKLILNILDSRLRNLHDGAINDEFLKFYVTLISRPAFQFFIHRTFISGMFDVDDFVWYLNMEQSYAQIEKEYTSSVVQHQNLFRATEYKLTGELLNQYTADMMRMSWVRNAGNAYSVYACDVWTAYIAASGQVAANEVSMLSIAHVTAHHLRKVNTDADAQRLSADCLVKLNDAHVAFGFCEVKKLFAPIVKDVLDVFAKWQELRLAEQHDYIGESVTDASAIDDGGFSRDEMAAVGGIGAEECRSIMAEAKAEAFEKLRDIVENTNYREVDIDSLQDQVMGLPNP